MIIFKDYNGEDILIPSHHHIIDDITIDGTSNTAIAYVSNNNHGIMKKEDKIQLDNLQLKTTEIETKLKTAVFQKIPSKSVLIPGIEFNMRVRELSILNKTDFICFTKTPIPQNKIAADAILVSDSNLSEVETYAYYENNTIFISPKEPSTVIYFHENCSSMFSNINFHSINLNNINTDNVTNMDLMFCNCKTVFSLDLSNFNTSNIDRMNSMFENCTNLTEILGLENFNTSKVIGMNRTFSNCTNLKSLDLSNFDTSNTRYMEYTFADCTKLSSELVIACNKTLSYTGIFDRCSTEEGTKFIVDYKDTNECIALAEAIVSSIQYESNVKLYEAPKATLVIGTEFNSALGSHNVNSGIDYVTFTREPIPDDMINDAILVSSSDSENLVYMYHKNRIIYISPKNERVRIYANQNMYRMFRRLYWIKGINFTNFNTSNAINMEDLFSECHELLSLDVSNFDTSKVTNMYRTFYDLTKVQTINVTNWNISNVTNLQYMFAYCYDLQNIIGIENFNAINVTAISDMFWKCKSLTSLDISRWNTSSKLILISSMFGGCSSLETLNISNVNTTNIKSFNYLFTQCTKLKEIKGLETLDTSNVTELRDVFNYCKAFTTIDISSWNLDKVKTLILTFGNMNVSSIKLPNIPSLIEMQGVFIDNTNLTTIEGIENVNVSNVKLIYSVFNGCSNLKHLDLSNWNTTNVTSMYQLFKNCSKLSGTITIKGNKLTDYREMFTNCSTDADSSFIVDYIDDATKSVADAIISTKSENSNVSIRNM